MKKKKTEDRRQKTELAALDAAIATTKSSITGHEEALRHLDQKLHNQLAEYQRQSTRRAA